MTMLYNPDRLAASLTARPDPEPGCRRWADADGGVGLNRPRGPCGRPAASIDAPPTTPTRRGYNLTALRNNLRDAKLGLSSDSVRVARRRLAMAYARRADDRRNADLRVALLYIEPRLLPRVRAAQAVIGDGFAAARTVVRVARGLVALARSAGTSRWVKFTRACCRRLPDLTPFFLVSSPPPPIVPVDFDLCSWWFGLTALTRFDMSYVARLCPS